MSNKYYLIYLLIYIDVVSGRR